LRIVFDGVRMTKTKYMVERKVWSNEERTHKKKVTIVEAGSPKEADKKAREKSNIPDKQGTDVQPL